MAQSQPSRLTCLETVEKAGCSCAALGLLEAQTSRKAKVETMVEAMVVPRDACSLVAPTPLAIWPERNKLESGNSGPEPHRPGNHSEISVFQISLLVFGTVKVQENLER